MSKNCSIALISHASLLAQTVKHLSTMRETWVWSLGREDLLEKEMATHSSILAWRIPWTKETGGLQSTGHKESDTTEWLHFHFSLSSAFSKTSLNIWKFTVHVLLQPGLENFEHYFTSMWDWVPLCGSLSILCHCLSLGLGRKLTFSSPVATAEFSKLAGILSAALSQHHLPGFEIAQLEFHHLH